MTTTTGHALPLAPVRDDAAPAVALRHSPGATMIAGARRSVGLLRMWGRVLWLAVRRFQNPLRAVTAVRRLRAAYATDLESLPRKMPLVSGRLFPSLYAPGWPSQAFDRCVERELNRAASGGQRPALRSAIVAMTRMCALRCEHCVEWDVLNRAEGMSADDLQAIVRKLRERGVGQLFFSGGEPLQRFDALVDLVAAVGGDADTWVLSSGKGLTRDKARRLRGAGLTGVALSLDHWDPAAHDAFRGRVGAFDAVERAAGHIHDAGLVLALSLCPVRSFVSEENLEAYATVAGQLGASFIQILEPKAVGHYAGQDVALSPAQVGALDRFVERLNLDPAARNLPVVSHLEGEARADGCHGAGDRYAYVDTDGTLHPCPFCRSTPVPLLGRDVHAAFAELQRAGCPSHRSHCSAKAET